MRMPRLPDGFWIDTVLDHHNNTPQKPCVRMPAEWEPHHATHLAFPINPNDWPGKFHAVRWAFIEMVRHLSHSEIVLLAVPNETIAARARRMLADAHIPLDSIEFFTMALDRGWMRDIAPFYVYRDSTLSCVKFDFNGWAKYPNYQKDTRWPGAISHKRGFAMRSAIHRRRSVVLEGGAIDTNGSGVLVTTEECLMDDEIQPRNPGFSRNDYEEVFSQYLGIHTVIWLQAGIVGDDTHGHVDDICRFVDQDTVVLCRESDSNDANYAVLEQNRERLESVRMGPKSRRLQIIFLPMPRPVYFRGIRLPASYANFYIGNETVLVPTFNDPADRTALGILSEVFPRRRVVGIHALDLVWGFGTIHCMSHEEPAHEEPWAAQR